MKKLFALLLVAIFAVMLIGCDREPPETPENPGSTESPAQSESPDNEQEKDENTHHKVDLDYFFARRYTATITENPDHIFWADNEGLHKYSKETQKAELLTSGKDINWLSVYGDFLYYVVDEETLCRINIESKNIETVYVLDTDYMSQIQDYTVSGGKVFFLNTHSLFYYEIEEKSVKDLKDTTVSELQVVGDDIYFTDHAERTRTIYVYSMNDGSCRIFLGDGEYVPMMPEHHDFRVVGDKIYYCQAMPGGTYIMDLNGESKIIANGCSTFICAAETSHGIYLMEHDLDESNLYFYDTDGNKSLACYSMMELNLNSGVAVVDGYAYYNSGFERVLKDHGHYSYNYHYNPTSKRLEEPEIDSSDSAEGDTSKEIADFGSYEAILSMYRKMVEICLRYEPLNNKLNNYFDFTSDTDKDLYESVFCSISNLFTYYDEDYDSFEYAANDLNSDGTEELILYVDGEIAAIFSMKDSRPVLLTSYWQMLNVYINTDGYIWVPGFLDEAFESCDIYRIDMSAPGLAWVYGWGSNSGVYYKKTEDGREYVSSREYLTWIRDCPYRLNKKDDIEMIPLFDSVNPAPSKKDN